MNKRILLEFLANAEDAQRKFRQMESNLTALNSRQASATFDLNTKDAEVKLRRMEQLLRQVDRDRVSPQVNVRIAEAMAKIALLREQLRTLDRRPTRINLALRNQLTGEIAALEKGLQGVVGDLAQTEGASASLGQRINDLAGFFRGFTPLLAGVGLAIVAAVLPAIAAMVASLGQAVLAVGALGAAFAAALGPAIAVVLGIAQRFAAVLAARQAKQTADNAATRQGAAAAQQKAAADEQRHDAARAVTNAETAVTEAVKRRTAAEQQARRDITAASVAEIAAKRALQAAQENLRQATVDAYRAIQDAADRAADSVRGLEHAQIDAQRAKLDLRDKKRALAEFLRGVGQSEDAINQLLKRTTDVTSDPRQLHKLLGTVKPGGLSGSQADELSRLKLDVEDAALGIKDANDAVSDAERERGRAMKDNAKLVRGGIDAYAPYRAALDAVAGANERAKKAEADYRRKLAQGVQGNPQVIAANQALAGAEDQLREARHNQKVTLQQLKDQQDAMSGSMSVYEKKRDLLSKAEQRFLDVLLNTKGVIKAVQSVTDPFFNALASVLGVAAANAGGIAGALQPLGKAFAGAFTQVAATLALLNWPTLIDGAVRLVSGLGTVVSQFLRLIGNVGAAAMGFAADRLDALGATLTRWADATSNAGGLKSQLQPLFDAFDAWIGLIGSVASLLLGFFQAAGPAGTQFVQWLSQGAKHLADWFKSKDGMDRTQQFFDHTLPLAKSIVHFIGSLVKLLVQGFEAAAPVIKPVVDVLSHLFDIASGILGFFNMLPGPVRDLAAALILANPAMGVLEGLFLKVGTVAEGITAGISTAGPKAIGAIQSLGTAMGLAWDAVVTAARAVGGLIVKAVTAGMRAAAAAARIAAAFIMSTIELAMAAGPFFLIGAAIIGAVILAMKNWGKIKAAVGWVWDHFKSVFLALINPVFFAKLWWKAIGQPLVHIFEGLWGWVKGGLNTVLNGIITGINWVIHQLNKIHFKVPDWIPHFGGRQFGIHIGDVGQVSLAAGGLVASPTLALVGDNPTAAEAVLPLTRKVFAQLAAGIVTQLQTGLVGGVGTGLVPAAAGAGGGMVQHNHFHIPQPMDSTRDPDPQHTAALLQQAWEQRGGGLS